MTPEGKVKTALKEYLVSIGCIPASHASEATYADTGWFFDPVPTGYGVAGVHDRIGHYKGHFFSLEVKAPGRRGQKNRGMSAAQKHQFDAIALTGGHAVVFDGGEDDWERLKQWVRGIDETES